MKPILTAAVIFTLIFPLPSPAQEAEPTPCYSLSDCLGIARANNPTIQKAWQEMEAATGKMWQALSGALPHLRAEGNYQYLDKISSVEFDGETIPTELHHNYLVNLIAEQTLFEGGQVLAGIKAAVLYNRFSEITLEEAKTQVDYTIKELFYRLLLAEAIDKVRSDTVEHMKNYFEASRQKFEKGSISEFELLTARVKLANSYPPLIQARNAAEILQSSLAKELGKPDQDFRISGELSYLPFAPELEELNQAGRKHRPLLEEVMLTEEMLKQNVHASRSGYLPRVSVFASYGGERPQLGFPPDDRWEFEWIAGAKLGWNLFDGLNTPGQVKEAVAKYEQARIEAEDTRRSVLLEIRQAYLDLKSAFQTLQSQQEVVAQAEKAFQIARIRWGNGLSTYLELNDAELALSEARVNLQEALAQYRIALSKIEKAVGLPLPELEEAIKQQKGESSNEAEG